MRIGNIDINDSEYFRLLLSQIISLTAEMNVQREFIQVYLSESSHGDLSKIQQSYSERYKKLLESLKNELYEKYGDLDLDGLLEP